MASLAADVVLFNSEWNRKSFVENISKHFKLIPDFRPKDLKNEIEPKTGVVYFPMTVWPEQNDSEHVDLSLSPHLIWAHRWEHDKNPTLLFEALSSLIDEKFRISIIGKECLLVTA